ncbi:uncharacterized protein [Primulina eburnea]|uniref:uncharacterized protein isoform X1 n=1 Tax=Primulina eburnea TaxID=1245227 RepID=UPI003C6C0CAB
MTMETVLFGSSLVYAASHSSKPLSLRFRACAADVPDFLSADWLESRRKRPLGPRLSFSAEEAVTYQLDALMFNDQPRPDYGIEVMYRFAGFDPFERSTYFGPFFDLGQFERFRRIFHHSSYRVLLGHRERKILSSLNVNENTHKQRVWIRGPRPEEEEVFQFTMVQLPVVRKVGVRTMMLRELISEMLTSFPVVVGRLLKSPEGLWMVKCNDAGLRMLEARARMTLNEWLRNVDREKELKLVHWEEMFHKPYFWSTFYVQITEFGTGGLAIDLSCTHLLSDPKCATM